jgi:uncharacterized protein YecT (DUF1311 family)
MIPAACRKPLLPLLLLATAGLTFAADDDEPVQTQAEMNQQAAADFAKADAQLNKVYKQVQAGLDADGLAKLKVAQRAWLAFRDADADFQADAAARGGTMAPCIYDGVRQQLTEARTAELRQLLQNHE